EIGDERVTGVQTCALPIYERRRRQLEAEVDMVREHGCARREAAERPVHGDRQRGLGRASGRVPREERQAVASLRERATARPRERPAAWALELPEEPRDDGTGCIDDRRRD